MGNALSTAGGCCGSLHSAARGGWLARVKYLVENNDADIDAISNDQDKYTALHVACGNGHIRVVEYLVGERSARLEAKDGNDCTPLRK